MTTQTTEATTRQAGETTITSSKTTDTAQQSSMEMSRNAKGDLSFSVKIYDDDAERMDVRMRDAIKRALAIEADVKAGAL